jgi:hypothetical protein
MRRMRQGSQAGVANGRRDQEKEKAGWNEAIPSRVTPASISWCRAVAAARFHK